ncbi:hypothetical protein SLS53_008159 [Cytospora paraplurivora]|uniref:Carboxymuconolactone decarboxylase-like domain-containing protein n=1 Tax=Cytospora paraplurivora TaxID=2898453 RepID=A0AAN9YD36_9PEZI
MDSATPTYQTSTELSELFSLVKKKYETTSLGKDQWYLLTISCLASGPSPETAADLYVYLINSQEHRERCDRQALVRRLREALVKSVALIGVCKPLEAMYAISRVEREEDKDYTTTRDGWQCDEANHSRSREFYNKLYGRNAGDTDGLFAAHRDFDFVCEEITYGFYLGDRQTLNDVETETIVLAAIMSQNLKFETHWHLRGTRRLGVSRGDVKVMWEAIQLIAGHFGTKLGNVPSIDEVEPDV